VILCGNFARRLRREDRRIVVGGACSRKPASRDEEATSRCPGLAWARSGGYASPSVMGPAARDVRCSRSLARSRARAFGDRSCWSGDVCWPGTHGWPRGGRNREVPIMAYPSTRHHHRLLRAYCAWAGDVKSGAFDVRRRAHETGARASTRLVSCIATVNPSRRHRNDLGLQLLQMVRDRGSSKSSRGSGATVFGYILRRHLAGLAMRCRLPDPPHPGAAAE
jgi:hypothetical protein